MTAFNCVRFKVKPGQDAAFLDAHKQVERDWPGMRHANVIETGEGRYCIIAEWNDMESLADLGGELGVTDPMSGPVVLELK
jgi:antibiotic biosynthesis monooxygenase (ABM) superfamily enzyme